MALADDAEEEVRGLGIAGEVADLIKDKKVWGSVETQPTFDGWETLLPKEVGDHGGERRETDGVPFGEGREAKVFGEGTLADARRAPQQDVLAAFEESEGRMEFGEQI